MTQETTTPTNAHPTAEGTVPASGGYAPSGERQKALSALLSLWDTDGRPPLAEAFPLIEKLATPETTSDTPDGSGTDETHPGRTALSTIVAGLPGVSDGPWHEGCFANDETTCQCKSVLNEGYAGAIATVHVNNGLLVGEGGNDAPPAEEAKANLRHISRCHPEAILSVSAYVESLERRLAEATALAYCRTDKGPLAWKDICDDAFWQVENLRRRDIKDLKNALHGIVARAGTGGSDQFKVEDMKNIAAAALEEEER